MKIFTLLINLQILLTSSLVMAASCPSHKFTPSAEVKLSGDSVLVVTHPSTEFDGRYSTKLGMDSAVRFAKERNIPVIYLQDDSDNSTYFFDDCEPDYWVFSAGGEISVDITPSHLYTVGGHWELCQSSTLNDILFNWSKKPLQDLTITYFMDGVYQKGMYFEETDPYINNYRLFMQIANYGRPGAFNFSKLTLLETMGIVMREDLQYEFLERNLPRFDRTLSSDYRVEIKLNDSRVKVLQEGREDNPPVLLFEFIDSAYRI